MKVLRKQFNFGRAIRLVWKSSPVWTAASAAIMIAQGILPLVGLYMIKLIIDTVTQGVTSADTGVVFQRVIFLIGLMGIVALVTAALDAAATWVNEAQSQVVTDYMHDVLHSKAVEVDLEYYENAEYNDTLHRAQQEVPFRPNRIVRGLVQLGQSAVSIIGIAILLITFSSFMLVVLALSAIPGVLIRLKYAKTMYQWKRKSTAVERKAEYFNYLLTLNLFAKEIRLFGLGPLFIRRFQNLRQDIRVEKLRIAQRRALAEWVTQSIALIPVIGSFVYMTYLALHQIITLGDMVMFYTAIQRGQVSLQSFLSGVTALYEDNLFLKNLYEFLDLKPKVADPPQSQPFPKPMQQGIKFEGVSFRYPHTDRTALEEINLSIRPGEVIALVGENGSGKTTLVKLLCRLYDPSGGKITVDGVDLRDLSVTSLRRQISVIFQDYVHYQMTARENIWLGDLDIPLDDENIIAAARHSGADQVISNLKHGYETPLGKFLENGEELSLGEWQKIALARAFLRDSQLIVLDEPTSSMDPKAEYEVFLKFRELIQDRSAILISHRLSTVRMADRIYVIDNGRVIESGSHEELMQCNGTYAQLFERQAQYYYA